MSTDLTIRYAAPKGLLRLLVVAGLGFLPTFGAADAGKGDNGASIPIPVRDLALWLDASATETLQPASEPLANTTRISAWRSREIPSVPPLQAAVQDDVSSQPSWFARVRAFRDRPAVHFDGETTFLHLPELALGADLTLFIVFSRAPQTSWPASFHRPLLAADNDPFRVDGDGYGLALAKAGASTGVFCLGGGDAENTARIEGLEQDGAGMLLVVRRQGAGPVEILGRGPEDANLVVRASGPSFVRTEGLHRGYTLGANPPSLRGFATRFYRGDIAEVILYHRALAPDEVREVEKYLAEKYEGFASGAPRHRPSPEASRAWHAWRRNRAQFPLAAWGYFDRYGGTLEEYKTYRDAGLTMVQCPLGHFETAAAAGLEALIGSWAKLPLDRDRLAHYVNFPTPESRQVAGYVLWDEPTPDLFDAMGQANQYIYENDKRDALPIIDLLPGRYDRAREFAAQAAPAVMLNCRYVIFDNGTTNANAFYGDLALLRSLALQNDIGLMGFVLCSGHWNYRRPSESDLRWMIYSHVAYGAQGIWYYNWRIDPDSPSPPGKPAWDEGMVRHADGSPMPEFPLIQTVNAELHALWPTIKQLRTTRVGHTSDDLPVGAAAWTDASDSPLTSLTATQYLVGQLKNIDDAEDRNAYVMLVNKRHAMDTASDDLKAQAAFSLAEGFGAVARFDPKAGGWQPVALSDGRCELTLGGGQGVLLRFEPREDKP